MAKTRNKRKTVNKRAAGKRAERRFSSRHGFLTVGLGVLVGFIYWSALVVHQTGSLKAIVSPTLRKAPLAGRDSTKLLTADGMANSASVLIKFKASTPAAKAKAIHDEQHATLRRTIADIGVQQVSLAPGEEVGNALKQYRSHGEVEYAEPNFVAQRFMTPNDTLYSRQWNLAKIGAPAAWDASQGGYGPVAVIDTGIDAAHSDLTGEVAAGYNFVNDSNDTTDDNGHGTHVAGIIAGTTNNANGVASIGFHGSLLPVKVLDASGAGTYGDVSSGIIYATDKGARVINLSLGGSSASQTLLSAIQYAQSRGVIVVAAAGNNGNSAAVYPADYPGVVAVSATGSDDSLATFSSYGPAISISAPGVSIVSTYNNGGYATMSGTSMAAPEVSGLLALAMAKNPSAGAVVDDLKQTADKVGPYAYDAKGWNQYYGYGRINAAKLLGLITTPPATATPVVTEPTQESGRTAHGQVGAQFSISLEGSIDSIDAASNKVTVKVQSISQNLKLAQNNLIDLYLTPTSTLNVNGQAAVLADLQPGDKISGKALWKDNQLFATDLKVQGSRPAQPSGQASPNGNGHGRAKR